MVHVEDTAVTNAAVVAPVRLPNIAHLAVPTPLCLVTHVESPIWWHNPRICHYRVVERQEKIGEKQMVHSKHDECAGAWQVWPPNKEDKAGMNVGYDTHHDGNEAHAIKALRREWPCA